MSTVTIPTWNALGLLPPINDDTPISPHRSPYPVSLKDVVMRFATSAERRAILQGFLNFRQILHHLGYTSGFQWLNGSFMENVETIENRTPRDIDVVTFMYDPKEIEIRDDEADLLDHDNLKKQFKVDAYFVGMDEISKSELAEQAAYWYSVWSHRRNQAWKGFLQIELNPIEDAEALGWLRQFDASGAPL